MSTHNAAAGILDARQIFLDVGCGSGECISDGYYTPYGIELSRELCRMANMRMKPRGGFCVHAPAVEGIGQFESGLFTGVILRSFLEHEWKPMELLAGVHRVLRDDGIIFVRVPNYASLNRRIRGSQWCGFRYPNHVNYFTPHILSRMAGDSGFHMKLLNPLKIAIDDNIKAVLTKPYFCELEQRECGLWKHAPKPFAGTNKTGWEKPSLHSAGRLPCAQSGNSENEMSNTGTARK